MDNDFMYGVIGVTLVVLAIIAALTTGFIVDQRSQLEFERICVGSHRNVIYAEVDGSLVSECK